MNLLLTVLTLIVAFQDVLSVPPPFQQEIKEFNLWMVCTLIGCFLSFRKIFTFISICIDRFNSESRLKLRENNTKRCIISFETGTSSWNTTNVMIWD